MGWPSTSSAQSRLGNGKRQRWVRNILGMISSLTRLMIDRCEWGRSQEGEMGWEEFFWSLPVEGTLIPPVTRMQLEDWTGKWWHWYFHQYVAIVQGYSLNETAKQKKNFRKDILSLGIVTIHTQNDWWALPKYGHLRSFCQLSQVTVSVTREGGKGKI